MLTLDVGRPVLAGFHAFVQPKESRLAGKTARPTSSIAATKDLCQRNPALTGGACGVL